MLSPCTSRECGPIFQSMIAACARVSVCEDLTANACSRVIGWSGLNVLHISLPHNISPAESGYKAPIKYGFAHVTRRVRFPAGRYAVEPDAHTLAAHPTATDQVPRVGDAPLTRPSSEQRRSISQNRLHLPRNHVRFVDFEIVYVLTAGIGLHSKIN